MSTTRCALQVVRGTTITDEVHNHPRELQIACQIEGVSVLPENVLFAPIETVDAEVTEWKPDAYMLLMRSPKLWARTRKAKRVQGCSGIFCRCCAKYPLVSSKQARTISNLFASSDENAREIFPGEHHAIVRVPNGKFGRANFTGPGTRIVERIKRGDPPRVLSDKVSRAHDLRYALAGDSTDKIRAADLKMLKSLEQLKREGTDRGININPAMIGISGKVLAENFGVLSKSAFIDPKFKPSGADKALMRSELKKMEQQGFGANTRRIFGAGNKRPLISVAGNTATHNLAKIGSWKRGRVLVDRHADRGFAVQLASAGPNTKAAFRNRQSRTNQTGSGHGTSINRPSRFVQHGEGQKPGASAPASSAMVNIKTKGRERPRVSRFAQERQTTSRNSKRRIPYGISITEVI